MPQFLDPEADSLAPNDLSKLEETVQAVLRLAALPGRETPAPAPERRALKDQLLRGT